MAVDVNVNDKFKRITETLKIIPTLGDPGADIYYIVGTGQRFHRENWYRQIISFCPHGLQTISESPSHLMSVFTGVGFLP